MDNKHHLQILGYKTIDYKNKKTGAPEQLKLAQCVITSKTEGQPDQIVIGELMMPRPLHDTTPGNYLAEFELAVGQDLRVGSRLARLHPLNAKPQAKAA